MNIEWIETFLDVLETQNFNDSAERLGITQSTVSHRIQKLENVLNVRLFQRGRSGANLTIEGKRFEAFARTIRHDWSQALNVVPKSSDFRSRLRIGIQYDVAKIGAGKILELLRTLYLDTMIYVEVDYSRQIMRDIERGDLDFAIVYTPNAREDIHCESLGYIDYAMVSTAPVHINSIVAEDYTFPNISPAFSYAHQQALPHLVDTPLECGQSDSLFQFLRDLGGASYLAKKFAHEKVAAGDVYWVKDAPLLRAEANFACHVKNRQRFKNSNLSTKIRQASDIFQA